MIPDAAGLIRRTLPVSGAEAAPAGEYDVLRTNRTIHRGAPGRQLQFQMASLHEASHAYLNASTTFGVAMQAAGAIAAAGRSDFEALIDRMIDGCHYTHEMYATISALWAATNGAMSDDALGDYPDYAPLLQQFRERFPGSGVFATVLLASCARAAMQTDICDRLLQMPCEEWPEIVIAEEDSPDWRFRRIAVPEATRSALAAVVSLLRDSPGALEGLLDDAVEPARARRLYDAAPPEDLDRLAERAYDVFAAELRRVSGSAEDYDAQRAIAERMRGRIGSFVHTPRSWVVPRDSAEDLDAVRRDFRREVVELRGPDRAVLLDVSDRIAAIGFVLRRDGLQYVQFTAMPLRKAAALYRFGAGELASEPEETLTAFRRRLTAADGAPTVELLRLDRGFVEDFLAENPGVEPLPIVSAATLRNPHWRREWESLLQTWDRLVVLVDVDAEELIAELSGEGERLQCGRLDLSLDASGDSRLVCFVCIRQRSEPDVLYLHPCSEPHATALLRIVGVWPRVAIETRFLETLRKWLTPALSHIIREESKFGDSLWEDRA